MTAAVSDPRPARTGPLAFALEGEKVRRASGVLEREAPALVTALRRALPFIARRGLSVVTRYARATPIAELLAELPAPLFAQPIAVSVGDARGALVFDAAAVALVLDGALGGDGRSLPQLRPQSLTAAQSAVMIRASNAITAAISDVLSARIGLQIRAAKADPDDAERDAALVACAIEIGDSPAQIVLLLPKDALLASERSSAPQLQAAEDPRIAAVVGEVDLELAAELARVPMKLSSLAALKVGDTLRLDVQVGSSVVVRAEGRAVLRGRPTTSGGRIAIKVERHEG